MSFRQLWENMELSKKNGVHDDKSMDAIRTGINVRENFWEDFMLVINNSSAMSALLDVPVVKISSWHSRVKTALEKVQQTDAVPDPKDKGKLLKTGLEDEGPDPKITINNQV